MVDGCSDCNTGLRPNLIKRLRILAAQHRKSTNILLQEAIEDLLRKYEREVSPFANQQPMKRDRREYSRVEVSWQVIMLTSKHPIAGEIKNISIDGALIICKELPSEGESFSLIIQMPNSQQTFRVVVEQIRLNINNSDTSLYSYHMAVRFVDLPEDECKLLSYAIEREARIQENVQSTKLYDYESPETVANIL
jgi:hypothetical protein